MRSRTGTLVTLVAVALLVAIAVAHRATLHHYFTLARGYVEAALRGGGDQEATTVGQQSLTLLPLALPSEGAGTGAEMVGPHHAAPSPMDVAAPLRAQEVFHVGRSVYTFADAPAVCRAFGAELATYAQVREAWEQGADWCSYGWVKGQAALFPTQQATWEGLQRGPEESRAVCGKPGVNGGFFDNPELRFGVNCYGKRPNHRQGDRDMGGAAVALPPQSAEQVEFEKRVQRFRDQMDGMPIA